MKKYLLILTLLTAITIFVKCTGGSSGKSEEMAKDSTTAEPENCSADNLFPIRPPSNAEPGRDNECDFYQWAWGTFLYITETDSVTKAPRFLSYKTPSEVFSINAAPLFAKLMSNKMLLLAPRLTEDTIVTGISEVEQATSKSILIDKNGRAIYYAQHINDTFVNFVKVHHFTNMDTLFAADSLLKFTRGSLELKSSWKIVMPGDDTAGFYTTWAMVAQFETKENPDGTSSVVINPGNLKEERVALLGIHVVGVAAGHPEFIWATFEHDGLAPNNNPARNPDSPSTAASGAILDVPVDSINHLFYTAGVHGTKCNLPNQIQNLQFDNEAKQTFKNRTEIFHQFWFDDDGLIKSLNENVHAKLGPGSVWSHYSFKGAVWLNDSAKFMTKRNFATDDSKDSTTIGGEKALSNVTMETFTQAGRRCFSCHKTMQETDPNTGISFPAKLISVSHILTNAYFNIKQNQQAIKKRL